MTYTKFMKTDYGNYPSFALTTEADHIPATASTQTLIKQLAKSSL